MKINRRKISRIFFILLITLSPFVVGGVLYQVNETEKKISCGEIKVTFLRRGEGELVSEAEVRKLISDYCGSVQKSESGFLIGALEELLEEIPAVRNAEVYRKINGELFVEIEQRVPVCKIYESTGQGFYLDESCEVFPLVPGVSARVPVVNGFLKEPYEKRRGLLQNDSVRKISKLDDLHALFRVVRRDPFRMALVEQVWVNESGEFELIPKIDDHVILFGDTTQMEGKFNKLKIFYEEGLNTKGWNSYGTVDLRFRNQIICKK